MGHIFISYSHKDTEYAHALEDRLQSMGFSVWIDARLDYGSQWPQAIQKYLDSCDAFILIMSPRSFASDWVQSELQRAKRKRKPVFPLLLEGDETWLAVESTQYYDVRNGKLPEDEFYADLRQAISTRGTTQLLPQSTASYGKTGRRNTPAFLVPGILAAILCLGLILGIPLFNQITGNGSNIPDPSVQSTSQETPTPPATFTAVTRLPVQLPDGSEVIIFSPSGEEIRYTILSAWRAPSSPGKHLLHLRIRVWTDSTAGVNFWSDSFRLAAEDIRKAPVNDLNLAAGRDENVDGNVEFEIDSSLKKAVLVINVGRIPDAWSTRELHLVFP